jgi:Secretion system C-terminal sorting domain
MTTSEGTSSVSTAAGNLLFYTNGVDVYDNTNTIMSNGTGLMGDISTTQCLIVPSPSSVTQYYIFTCAPDGGANGFRYSIVDMTLNGGLGDVTATKNVLLTDSTTEKIAAIKDDAGTGYWIVMHKWGNNMFFAYHLTSTGLSAPIASIIGTVHNTSAIQNTYGQMKFNMCGDKLAVAIGYQDIVEVFDFDQITGNISNPLTINMGANVYGVEFSKSSELLYVSCYDVSCKLAQFNISLATTPLILASKTPLSATDDLYALQYAPDGKIYVARSFGTSYLGVINSPDTPGSACNYSDTGLDLDPTFSGVNGALGLPSFSQDFLKVNVICSPTSVSNEMKSEFIKTIFPNPSTNEFSLDLSVADEPAQIFVYDASGKTIESFSSINPLLQFGKKYEKGIYFVKVVIGDNQQSQKIIKM